MIGATARLERRFFEGCDSQFPHSGKVAVASPRKNISSDSVIHV